MKKNILAILLSISFSLWVLGVALLSTNLSNSSTPVRMVILVLLILGPLISLGGVLKSLESVREQFYRNLTHNRNVNSRINEIKTRTNNLQRRFTTVSRTMGAECDSRDQSTSRRILRLAVATDLDLALFFTPEEAADFIAVLVSGSEPELVLNLLDEFPDSFRGLRLTEKRSLVKTLRAMGFYEEALAVMRDIAKVTGKPSDKLAVLIHRSQLDLFRGDMILEETASTRSLTPIRNRVLHMVGKALPETQSGYTLRTHYTVKAQRDLGVAPIVAVQAGVGDKVIESPRRYDFDGVEYIELAGPRRNKSDWQDWMQSNINSLAQVVEEERPVLIHAHSDFINVLIATEVGERFGIPVVNETRGFWEESWISRASEQFHWKDLQKLESQYGLPSAYTLRKEREIELREKSSAVVTLANVMEKHIADLRPKNAKSVLPVHVIPNAVDPEKFPVVTRDAALLSELGISENSTVVGYISSIVEYEGIDTLIRAFSRVTRTQRSIRGELEESEGVSETKLLIVGDGPVLEELTTLVRNLSLEDDVILTGRVDHNDILRYYSIIDIFVVPRKSSDVTELVTPLKPFEALSTGRACIFSSVAALKEIQEQSGAALLFEPGNHEDLAVQIQLLLDLPSYRNHLGAKGADWVRRERTWSANAERYLELYSWFGYHAQ